MGDWQTFEGHRARVTEDMVIAEPNGHMNPSQIRWLLDEVIWPVIAEYGLAYVLLDARNGTPADSESRRLISRWVRTHPGQTLFAVYGASRTASAVGMLLVNAIRLLSGRQIQLRMFEQSKEAQDWLMAQRERRNRQQPFEL